MKMKNKHSGLRLRKCKDKRCKVCVSTEEDNCNTDDENSFIFDKLFI